jgi:hypothetical protein
VLQVLTVLFSRDDAAGRRRTPEIVPTNYQGFIAKFANTQRLLE